MRILYPNTMIRDHNQRQPKRKYLQLFLKGPKFAESPVLALPSAKTSPKGYPESIEQLLCIMSTYGLEVEAIYGRLLTIPELQ